MTSSSWFPAFSKVYTCGYSPHASKENIQKIKGGENLSLDRLFLIVDFFK